MIGIEGKNGFVSEKTTSIYVSKPAALPPRNGIDYEMLNSDNFGLLWCIKYNALLVCSSNNGISYSYISTNGLNSGHFSLCFDRFGYIYSVNAMTKEFFKGTVTRNGSNFPTQVVWEQIVYEDIDENDLTPWADATPFDVAFNIDDALYLTAYNGHIYKSVDFGVSFTDMGQFADSGEICRVIKCNSVGHIFFTSLQSLYVSTDNGATFSKRFTFDYSSSKYINGISIDNEDTVFISEFSDSNVPCKLFVSYDGGNTFDAGTYIDKNSDTQAFYGLACYDIGKLAITTRTNYCFQALFSQTDNLNIVEKTLDNAEIVCVMNKGNDAITPTFGLSPTRYAETVTPISVIRKDITIELKRDNFTDITVSVGEDANILIDCKHD